MRTCKRPSRSALPSKLILLIIAFASTLLLSMVAEGGVSSGSAASRSGSPSAITPLTPSITVFTADSDSYTGWENKVYASDDNTVYVAYKRFLSDPSQDKYLPAELRVAKSTDAGQIWTTTVVDPQGDELGDTVNNSVAIDGDGGSTIYVAYDVEPALNNRTLKVAKSTDAGLTWSIQTVATGLEAHLSIRVLNANTAVISIAGFDHVHGLITQDGGVTWDDSTIPTPGGAYTSVGGADARSIWISYFDGALNAAQRSLDGSWTDYVVDDSPVYAIGRWDTVTVTPDRAVFIAYQAYDDNGELLRVARSNDNGASWSLIDVKHGPPDDANTAIHQSNGLVYLSFRQIKMGSTVASLALSRDSGLTWSAFAIPETLYVTEFLDSTVPSATTQYLSYQVKDASDTSKQYLRVARIGRQP